MECGDHLARSREMLPEVQHRRRRPLAIASLIVLQAVTIAIVARPHPQPPPEITTYAPQLTFVAPPSPPPDPGPRIGERPSCPPPRHDAPWVAPKLDEDIIAVRPAPSNAGWIVAWNHDHVLASYDAGATFQRVLDGDGQVRSASFDCWGHIVVQRAGRIGVRDGTREAWHAVGGLDATDDAPGAIIGGGPDIVVVGRAAEQQDNTRVAISSDGGVSWRFHEMYPRLDADNVQGQQHTDGSIDLAYSIGDCMNDDVVIARIAHGHVETTTQMIAEGSPFRVDDDAVLADGGWISRAGGDWHTYPFTNAVIPVPGAHHVMVSFDKTYRFVHGELRELPLVVEGTPQAVDLAGRVWSVACGKPLVAKRTATGVLAQCTAGD
jgi:hypothetical protein